MQERIYHRFPARPATAKNKRRENRGLHDYPGTKDNIMFQDGTTITLEEASLEKNINIFKTEINTRTEKLIRVLRK